MQVEYEVKKLCIEHKRIYIEDEYNVFLKGTNPYDGLDTYFGMWKNNDYFVIVTLISNRNISYQSYRTIPANTEKDIKEFLEHNRNVDIISKDQFQEQINKIRKIINI